MSGFIRRNYSDQEFSQGYSGSSEGKLSSFMVRRCRCHHGVSPDSRVTKCVAQTCLRLHHRHRLPGEEKQFSTRRETEGARDSSSKVDHICEIRKTLGLNGRPESLPLELSAAPRSQPLPSDRAAAQVRFSAPKSSAISPTATRSPRSV